MSEALAAIILLALLAWPQLRISSLCSQHHVLQRHQHLLRLVAICWWIIPVVKICWVDSVIPPADAAKHEMYGRYLARFILTENWGALWDFAGFGNKAFRIYLGVFFAITNAPIIVSYAINGTVALMGSLSLLELCCREMRATCMPTRLVLLTTFTPTALFWTTTNLKEGLVFWGICTLTSVMLSDRGMAGRLMSGFPGILAILTMRPHVAVLCIAGPVLGSLVRDGKVMHAAFGCLLMVGGMGILPYAAPALWEKIASDGASDALEESYEERADIGGSSLGSSGGKPIPVVTGLILLTMRPFIWEVRNPVDLIACLEISWISCSCLWAWRKRPDWRRLLYSREFMSAILMLLCLSLLFSYTYNMGLMVRQRLQVFPAFIILTMIPMTMPCDVFIAHASKLSSRMGGFRHSSMPFRPKRPAIQRRSA